MPSSARDLLRPCVPSRGRGVLRRRSLPVRAQAAGRQRLHGLWAALLREPWDSPPASVRVFLASEIAAVVAEKSGEGALRLTPFEGVGLRLPVSADEATSRAAANIVRFRQSYACVLLAVLLANALARPAALLGLVSLAAALVASSDRLLGEVAMASEQRLAWNGKRVLGLDRLWLRCCLFATAAASLGVAALLWPAATARWGVRSSLQAALLCALHAVTRPLDLGGAVTALVADLRAAKTGADARAALEAAARSAWQAICRPRDPFPVVIVTAQRAPPSPSGPGPGPGAPPSASLPPGRL